MKDSLQWYHAADLSVLGVREVTSAGAGNDELLVLKKQRVAKEFSQCLDAILDQSEFLYSISNATHSNSFEPAFTVPTATSEPVVTLPKPAGMIEPLQSISAAPGGGLLAPAPLPAENLINSLAQPPAPLPSVPTASFAPLPVPASFGPTQIETSMQ